MAKNKVTITWDGGARERQKPRVNSADSYGTVLADNTIHYSDYDQVPDMDDPTNPDKRWIQLLSGWYIATRYPSSTIIVERARVEPIVAPLPGLPTLNVSLKAQGYPDLNIEWKPNA